MRFNRFLHLIAFAGKAHRGSPASGGLTTKMPDGGAPSQAMSQPDFSPYLPLPGGEGVGDGQRQLTLPIPYPQDETRSRHATVVCPPNVVASGRRENSGPGLSVGGRGLSSRLPHKCPG